ncbi:MAG: PAS domain S-box protein, partial [Polyangiales bacterium]
MDVRDDNSPSIAICAALAAVDSVLRRALADIGAAELQVLSDGALSARLSQPRPLLWVADKDTWLRMSTHCPANQRSAPQRVLLLDTPSALNSLMAGDGALPVDLAMQLPVQQLEIETGLRTLLTLLRVEVRAGDSLNPPAVRTMPGTPALLASLIDASADAIIVANMHGRILLFNHSAERLYGYRARDVVGRMRVDRLYFGRQSIEIMHKLRAAAHGGSARLLEYPVQARCADGQPVPILLSASLVYEGDKVVASFGVARDLREQIRAERRL